jgi:hypothetical protein
MYFRDIDTLAPAAFKRLTGVDRALFDRMTAYLEHHAPGFGRPPKLSIADQLLLTLSYWREYRTMFHVAADYRISEPTTCRIIRRVEDLLARSPDLRLPERTPRPPSDLEYSLLEYSLIVIDATETPINRPKKKRSNAPTTAARRSGTPSKRRS